VEEADGVGAAGDGDGDAASGGEHGVAVEGALEVDKTIISHE
jgi:hypothetical protein